MINPSIHGWIDKYFAEQKHKEDEIVIDEVEFYEATRKTGFIFGHIVAVDTIIPIDIDNWLPIEISKIERFELH